MRLFEPHLATPSVCAADSTRRLVRRLVRPLLQRHVLEQSSQPQHVSGRRVASPMAATPGTTLLCKGRHRSVGARRMCKEDVQRGAGDERWCS